MKICLLHRYPLSQIEGTNPSFSVFLDKAIQRGYEIFLITYKDEDPPSEKINVKISEIPFTLDRKNPLALLFKSLLFVVIAPLMVWHLNRKHRFDVIYCDDSFPLYELFIKHLTNTRTLIRRGDLMCAYILDRFGSLSKLLYRVAFAVEKHTWKRVDGISVITNRFKRFLMEHRISPKKIMVIEDSIDFEKFSKKKTGMALKLEYGIDHHFVVMFHGVLLGIKGVETLVLAAPHVIQRFPHVRFFIIGEGDDYDRLKNLIQVMGVESHVILTGWVPYDDIQSYLDICDVGVPIRKYTLANRLIITTALLQYWASGKPVIAPDIDAVSEVVEDGVNGFLFEPGNPKSLSSKIIKAIMMRDQLKAMGKSGGTAAVHRYNSGVIADKMCMFIERDRPHCQSADRMTHFPVGRSEWIQTTHP